MTVRFESPEAVMRHAIDIAYRGQGHVEPNPMVGAVLVDKHLQLVGDGWHAQVGGPHAEVAALSNCDVPTHGLTLYVTLEPCNHTGRTPPCTNAIQNAGISKVVVGCADPAPHTGGAGIRQLESQQIEVEVGLLEPEARQLIAPFRKFMTTGRPWVLAKWAMTLDGKIATRDGHSQWISSPESRAIVHEIRGRVDAVIVGRGTVAADDPLLTARPAGARVPLRVVLDRQAQMNLDTKLVQTAREVPTIVCVNPTAPAERVKGLTDAGVEVEVVSNSGGLKAMLEELGRRECTNVLVEGGGKILGAFLDEQLIDETHVFIAPKIVGGAAAATPIAGHGLDRIPDIPSLHSVRTTTSGTDTYITGYVNNDALSQ